MKSRHPKLSLATLAHLRQVQEGPLIVALALAAAVVLADGVAAMCAPVGLRAEKTKSSTGL